MSKQYDYMCLKTASRITYEDIFIFFFMSGGGLQLTAVYLRCYFGIPDLKVENFIFSYT